MLIIGILGRARHGKTSAANAIEKELRRKEISVEQYDVGKQVLQYCIAEGLLPDKPRSDLTAAELKVLVEVGKGQREKDQYFWLMRIKQEMREDKPQVAIIPNVRFQNEIDFIKDRDGFLIRVLSLNPNGSEFISTDREPNDPTETALHNAQADYYIKTYRGQTPLVQKLAVAIVEYAMLGEK